jgi:hypothetical protein
MLYQVEADSEEEAKKIALENQIRLRNAQMNLQLARLFLSPNN